MTTVMGQSIGNMKYFIGDVFKAFEILKNLIIGSANIL